MELGVSDFGVSPEGTEGGGQGTRSTVSAESISAETGGSDGDVESTEGVDPRFALADAVRRLIRLLVAGRISDEAIVLATASTTSAVDALEATAQPGRRPRSQPRPDGHPRDFFPTSPVIGSANPLSPPVEIVVVDGEIHGRVTFDTPYEGPPSCVHGGVIAMVFDELLGAANIVAGNPGMTGTLTIRYHKPTPLQVELRVVARCRGKEGRKIQTWGAVYFGDVMTAEAEGIFVEMDPKRFLEIASRHADSPEALARLTAEASRIGVTEVPSGRGSEVGNGDQVVSGYGEDKGAVAAGEAGSGVGI